MELKLKMHVGNRFPKGGIFIKSPSIYEWLHEIQSMNLALDAVRVFPVPGPIANELYGCLVIFKQPSVSVNDIRKNNFVQLVESKLFIPENTIVSPELSKQEWETLFSENYHFLHPETGLFELDNEILWSNLLQPATRKNVNCIEPSKGVSIPQLISSFRIEVDQEAILKEIENPPTEAELIEKLPFDMNKLMRGNQRELDKFLAFLEKNPELALQYAIPLDKMGTTRGGTWGSISFGSGFGLGLGFGKGFNFNWIGRILSGLGSSSSKREGGFFSGMRLVYIVFFIIVLRSCQSSHFGSVMGLLLGILFVAVILGIVFSSLFGGGSSFSGSSGRSALIDSARFNTLENRYEKLAEHYIENKDYQKAAHIYLKLLKNHYKAATVLEQGKLYHEAAAVYLKYQHNKTKAAECYEKGHAYSEALQLYKELNEHEKVGDMHLLLKNKTEADKYFQKVIDNYKTNFQYVKAALLYKKKMGCVTEAQQLLLAGWTTKRDASNCLTNYFANIDTPEELSEEIVAIYEKETNQENQEVFLQLLKHEYSKHELLQDVTKNIAYEIVASKIDKKPEIASELIHFNRTNKSLTKDVMKFKLRKKLGK